jgi:hypothetical protein
MPNEVVEKVFQVLIVSQRKFEDARGWLLLAAFCLVIILLANVRCTPVSSHGAIVDCLKLRYC